MSHEKREWFVSIGNEDTHKVVFNIDGFNQNTDFKTDVTVYEKVTNGEAEYKKNLARISLQDKLILERNSSRMRLKFKVYMRETPNSKIFLWTRDPKPKKTVVKKTPVTSLV